MKISALRISPDRYVCVSTLADLASVLFDPVQLYETNNQKILDNNPRLRAAKEQRGENQRPFNPARIKRAEDYRSYIHAVDNNLRRGGYPTVTIWCKESLEFIPRSEDFNYGVLVINGQEILTANDGETQLAARFMLAKEDPSFNSRPFAFSLKTNSNKEEAMQTLHDMNRYATPVSEKETAALNVEGPLTKAINDGIAQSGVNPGRIQQRGDMPNKKSTNVTTMFALLHGAIGALNGKEEWVYDRSASRQLNEANGQYTPNKDSANRVSPFIKEVLALPENGLKNISAAHMMALGILYSRNGKMSMPLSQEEYVVVIDQLRGLKGEKSKLSTKEIVQKLVEIIK